MHGLGAGKRTEAGKGTTASNLNQRMQRLVRWFDSCHRLCPLALCQIRSSDLRSVMQQGLCRKAQIRSSLAKSSEACKAWAPSGDSTASWWCKSKRVRSPEKTCIIQPWFRMNGYPNPSEHGFRPHEEQSKSHNGSRGGYPNPQSHGC